jgi:hypothetical protein
MVASEPPSARPVVARHVRQPSADVIPLKEQGIPLEQPANLSRADALKIVRLMAANTDNIVLIPYGRKKAAMRKITRRQIELCVQKGTPTEGPFLNHHGHWQMNLYRLAAGEGITCVVAMEWAARVLVINAF